MAEIFLPIRVNVPDNWMELVIERLKQDKIVKPVVHGMWLSKEYMYGDPDVGIADKWIERRAEQSDDYAYCSVCKEKAEYDWEQNLILSDYCPSCGAMMDLDNNK